MGEILYNVCRVDITPLDELTGSVLLETKKLNVTCDSEIELDPKVSQGQEKTLRDRKKMLAVVNEPDLTYGYKLKLKNTTFDLNLAALIEGGKIRYDTTDKTKIVGYDNPMLSDGCTTKPFITEIYVENYEGRSVKNYAKITMNYCVGKATKMSFKKDFFSPEFEIECSENTKAKLTMKSIDFVDKLPA